MNTFFRRLPLPVKLILIGLLPMAMLLIVAIQLLNNKNEKLEIIGTYQRRIQQSANLSALIEELQVERRFSFGYAVKNAFQSEMVLQRSKTDAAIAKVTSENMETLPAFAEYTFVNGLGNFRTRVSNKQAYATEVMAFYTNIIFRLNSINNIAAGNVLYLRPVMNELIGQKLLSEMTSYLGMIRSNVYLMLDTREITPEGISSVKQIYAIYNTYVKELQIRSFPVYKQYLATQNEANLRSTLAFLNKVENTSSLDTTLSSELWWTRSANGVDQIRVLQQSLLNRLRTGMDVIYTAEKRSRDLTIFLIVLLLAVVIFFVAYVIRQITATLDNLREATDAIAAGKTGVRLPVESNDVIGSLTTSILEIDINNKKLTDAAEQIGKGNFDVTVEPRSKEDLLGNAMVQMKADLQTFNAESQRKIWIQTGITQVNDATRGEKSVEALCKDTLEVVINYLGCETGVFYTANKDHLEFIASHAIADQSLIPKHIAFGEKLTGQAAKQKKLVHLQDVPEDYLKISSGTGAASPGHVLILPLVQNGEVEGVIELASFRAIDDNKQELLREINGDIAIALQAAKSRQRLQELFEETQAQAEELQAQHSELENMNTELEAQSNKLQASEEELRVQQEELQQTNEELEERSRLLEEKNALIVERNLEIQRKAEELEISTKYKSEFLANMSHELRTPLNSILLLSRLLSDNNENNLSADQVEYAQVIRNSGTGLLSLIDEILDLSKIEAGKMDLEYASVPLAEITNTMRSLFAPVAKEKGVALNINIAEGIPVTIETDRMRLEQILKNLLSNALKFTSAGSVSLNVEQASPGMLTFTVTDTGIGIAKEKQALIFEAFQQEDGSTRRKYGGTGLGLSISRELAKLLGGEIKLASEAGKGSEFSVSIPIAKPSEKPVPAKTASPLPSPRKAVEPPVKELAKNLRSTIIPDAVPDDREAIREGDKSILIIEDDTPFAKALLDFTRAQGYKGIVAVRGDEGIELAAQFNPVGILLDIQLPVRDGWEVMEALKGNPATRHIPVHMMSSLESKKESMMKGAIDFINKPVAFEQMGEVFRKIEEVLSKKDKKVLIIEENPKHARALAYFLETFNLTSEVSTSMSQSVEALKQEGVDCVILDMGIPDAKAYEALEEVKRNAGFENLPVIIFTGKSLSGAEESKIRQYADSIVVKTAHSYQRVLDEVSLFLHLVEQHKGSESSSKGSKRLGALGEVLSGKKILVTDDDVRNIFSLTKALEGHNMEVFSAIDGKDALRQLEAHPDLDVVLMDIMMPEMDGYETMRHIRQNPKHRNLPIIAVTAKAMTGDREKCIKAGASDYISKPVDVDQLLSLLRVWLYEKSF
jgi:signal transduction histidine kinase/DNA-binding response OmpR family regulator/methyl-accepting chemotaxis protein